MAGLAPIDRFVKNRSNALVQDSKGVSHTRGQSQRDPGL